MTTITEMTYDELRIACAERCGWKNIRWIESISGRWLCGDHPNKDSEIPKFDTDMNACMELMEEIWEKEEYADSFIEKRLYSDDRETLSGVKPHLLYKILGKYNPDIGRCALSVTGNTLPIAIMRAFLTVMGEKE